jgi:GNAT superfamily N-acetyltransferase
MIRPLDHATDADAVRGLFRRASDYVDLVWGEPPGATQDEDFWQSAPPGIDPVTTLRLGLLEKDRLQGVAELAFGYPEPPDAYLGLLLLTPEARGRGLGRFMLRRVEGAARARGAPRLLLAVLEANPRARVFWEREGFGSPRSFPPRPVGARTHVMTTLSKAL